MKTIKQAYDIVYDGDLVYQMLEFAFERLIEVKKKTKYQLIIEDWEKSKRSN